MKKAYRVKSEEEFQIAFQNGVSFANRQLVLYVYPKPGQAHFRVGFSVSKKLGNAVNRNRIKRRLRQIMHELSPFIRQDADYLLIARFDIKHKDYQQMKQSAIHVMNIASVIDHKKLEEWQNKQ